MSLAEDLYSYLKMKGMTHEHAEAATAEVVRCLEDAFDISCEEEKTLGNFSAAAMALTRDWIKRNNLQCT